MPYKNVPKSLWTKMESCVSDVMKQGKSKSSAIAICYRSLMKKKKANEKLGHNKVYSVFDVSKYAASEDSKSEIQILPTGEFNTLSYGMMQVLPSHFDQMVANFKSNVRKLVPVDVDHNGGKAAGWIIKLINKGEDGLWGIVEWTKYGKELLDNKLYRLFSAEWSFDYLDPEHGSSHGATLIAGTLTNRPLFKELPILASETVNEGLTSEQDFMLLLAQDQKKVKKLKQNSMNLEDLLKKSPEKLEASEVAFLKENLDKISEEDQAKFGLKASEEEPKDQVTIKASELEALKAKAEAGEKAASELKAKEEELAKREASEKIESFVASETNPGRILPKSKELALGLYLSASDEQKEQMIKFMESLPELNITKNASDQNGDNNADKMASERLDLAIKEAIKKASEAGKEMKYADAIKVVASEQPELYKEYEKELSGK